MTTDATPATTAPETSTTPTATTSPATPAPPSSNVDDCFDGDCTLLLTGPVEVPLDAATFYYSSMHVTEISPDTLSYYVPYPDGGGTQSTIGAGLGSGEFGFQGQPSIRVGLVVVDGTPALVLQPGAAA
ncbi:hypothetical protein AB0G02_18610 [Actinosynnema sp. NPDC023658]|uniref:hypothetical protein n=1 Tax=Actinosynnema sp. NPDC023658 TaxID=3155465 RepID=UPI0033ED9C19